MFTFFTALAAGGVVWLLIGLMWGRKDPLPPSSAANLLLNVEGLRGYLAFGVFLHHAIVTQGYLATGRWEAPAFHPATLIGEGGVALFFIITAFLFWSKAISTGGKIAIKQFFKGRLLRLAPLYLSVSIVVIILSFLLTSFQLNQSPVKIATEVGRWLALGIFGTPRINGVDSDQMVAGVFWSLWYEWRFYLALPIAALLLRLRNGRTFAIVITMAVLFVVFFYPSYVGSRAILFAGGIFCAHLWTNEEFRTKTIPESMIYLVAGLSLAALTFFETAYGSVQVILFSILFMCILKASKKSLITRLMTIYPARALGTVSYSVYMVHGLVLYALRHVFPSDFQNLATFFLITIVGGLLVAHLSLGTFLTLEYPFFRKGRTPIRQALGLRTRVRS